MTTKSMGPTPIHKNTDIECVGWGLNKCDFFCDSSNQHSNSIIASTEDQKFRESSPQNADAL